MSAKAGSTAPIFVPSAPFPSMTCGVAASIISPSVTMTSGPSGCSRPAADTTATFPSSVRTCASSSARSGSDNAISTVSRPSAISGSLARTNDHRNAARFSAAQNAERDLLANAVRTKMPDQIAHTFNRFTVPGRDDISQLQACLPGRPAFLQAHHHRTAHVVLADRVQACAKVSARNVSFRGKRRGDTVDGLRRYDKRTPMGAEQNKPDETTFGVKRRAAFGAGVDASREPDAPVDQAAAHAAPGRACLGDDTEPGNHRILRAADGNHQVAGIDLSGRLQRGRIIRAVGLQECKPGCRITADELRRRG